MNENKELIRRVLQLLEQNRNRSSWDSDLGDRATFEFLSFVSKQEEFSDIFDFEFVVETLRFCFFELGMPQKKNYEESDAIELLQLLKANIEINIKPHWVVVPLINASLTNTVKISDNLVILAGNREEKIKQLSDIVGIDYEKMLWRCEHTEDSRSADFFVDPLLLICINHTIEYAYRVAVVTTYYSIIMLQLLYWANIYPNHRNRFLFRPAGNEREINRHLAIHPPNDNWRHQPLNFNYECDFNLDWLDNAKIKDNYVKLFSLLNEKYFGEEVVNRFIKAMNFFDRGLNVNGGNRYFDEKLDAILQLVIATEVLFVKDRDEKKTSKVVKCLSKLGDIDGTSEKKRRKLVREMCNIRGEYVHSGMNFYYGKKEDLTLLKRMVARVLSNSHRYINSACGVALSGTKTPTEAWFDYLDSI